MSLCNRISLALCRCQIVCGLLGLLVHVALACELDSFLFLGLLILVYLIVGQELILVQLGQKASARSDRFGQANDIILGH